ncbi:hypothetical protein G3I44_14095 [Halogeometricum borinquense]|uniref:Uncharacterized protein n=1 Tax=Halogeometricum borinquense TaxID=60847 RepID=A0A6C0UQU7_9EURY|nr:hypothetical protein [Halogeometricum borinquense]QIB75318.1 hypothetical protein G3I44_14095 [Halogeometricum borinquense]
MRPIGLDITAYENVEEYDGKVETNKYGDISYEWLQKNDLNKFYVAHEAHRPRADGVEGICRISGEVHTFRAGSYSGYSAFRNLLATFLLNHEGVEPSREISEHVESHEVWNNSENFEGKPFYEIINFSDCEGTIGPETSAKLAQDFEEHEEDVKSLIKRRSDSSDYYVRKYDAWMQAFKLAATTGAVEFH